MQQIILIIRKKNPPLHSADPSTIEALKYDKNHYAFHHKWKPVHPMFAHNFEENPFFGISTQYCLSNSKIPPP